jgi:nucleotide-binding universal stress UspA family protein
MSQLVLAAAPSTQLVTGKRISLGNALLLTDFSPSSELALPWAVALASRYEGKIVLAHVISPEMYEYAPPELVPQMRTAIERYGNRRMELLLSQAEFRNVPFEGIVCRGEIWETVRELIDTLEINVIVVGTHGRRGLTKVLTGAVAEEILRLSRIPVLTVGPHCEGFSSHQPQRILCASDFSVDSVQALVYALSIAETFAASLTLAYVAPVGSEDPSSRTRAQEFFSGRLRELLIGEASRLERVRYRVEFGAACDGILEAAANERADLIVMGVRGIGSAYHSSHRLGTTADEVVGSACCPVLTMRRSNRGD